MRLKAEGMLFKYMKKEIETESRLADVENYRLRQYNQELVMMEKRHELELKSVYSRHKAEKNRQSARFNHKGK